MPQRALVEMGLSSPDNSGVILARDLSEYPGNPRHTKPAALRTYLHERPLRHRGDAQRGGTMGHAHTLNRLAEVPYAIFQSGATRPSEDAYDSRDS